jgi:hypothetical protein
MKTELIAARMLLMMVVGMIEAGEMSVLLLSSEDVVDGGGENDRSWRDECFVVIILTTKLYVCVCCMCTEHMQELSCFYYNWKSQH